MTQSVHLNLEERYVLITQGYSNEFLGLLYSLGKDRLLNWWSPPLGSDADYEFKILISREELIVIKLKITPGKFRMHPGDRIV